MAARYDAMDAETLRHPGGGSDLVRRNSNGGEATCPWGDPLDVTGADLARHCCACRTRGYGLWWKDARTAIFYHDGKQVAEIKLKGEFLEPMYLFFDSEPRGKIGGLPTVESLRDKHLNTMKVDWIRSWTLQKQ